MKKNYIILGSVALAVILGFGIMFGTNKEEVVEIEDEQVEIAEEDDKDRLLTPEDFGIKPLERSDVLEDRILDEALEVGDDVVTKEDLEEYKEETKEDESTQNETISNENTNASVSSQEVSDKKDENIKPIVEENNTGSSNESSEPTPVVTEPIVEEVVEVIETPKVTEPVVETPVEDVTETPKEDTSSDTTVDSVYGDNPRLKPVGTLGGGGSTSFNTEVWGEAGEGDKF